MNEERTMEPLDITRASPEELRQWLDQLPDGTTIIKESNSFDGAVTLRQIEIPDHPAD